MSRTPRRTLRHQETFDEIIGHAVAVMGEHGAAGLSLGEVARRMGIRTPSLYTYVESKNVLYDELFRRGWQACLDDLRDQRDRLGPVTVDADVVARAVSLTSAFARWCIGNTELAQLMLTRPVPAWQPSAEAFAPSVAVFALLSDEVGRYLDLGLLGPGADVAELGQNLASAMTGVIVRQVSNEPGVPFDTGTASRHLPALVESLISTHRAGRN